MPYTVARFSPAMTMVAIVGGLRRLMATKPA
jgi:hypothetical protein